MERSRRRVDSSLALWNYIDISMAIFNVTSEAQYISLLEPLQILLREYGYAE